MRADRRYGVKSPSPTRSATTRTSPRALSAPRATRPASPARSYGTGPKGRNLLGKSVRGSAPFKEVSSLVPSGPIRGGKQPLSTTSLGRGGPLRGTTGAARKGSTPAGAGSSSYGGPSVRASSYWGGYGSYGYSPYGSNYSPYSPYYPSYSHCSPWSYGYYGSHFSFNFGGWFYPYGFYFNSYRNPSYSYWSPFDYSYCLPTYYSVVYVTESYDADPSDSLPATAPSVVIEDPSAPAALPAPAQKPLDTGADRFISLGDSAFAEGRYTDAVQLYAKAIEYAPEEASLYLVLADALFASGDYHYAAYVIRKALELDPLLAGTQVDKHSFYSDPAILDQQLAVLESYLVRNPIDRDARLVLALNYLFSARPAAGVDLLEATQAASLREDAAAQLILQAARQIQHGPRAE